MPSLGSDMEAGTLLEWRIAPGDAVSRGDVVAVVDTFKGAIDVEIFETGVVEEILVPVGEKVPVGTPLARLRVEGEPAAAPVAAAPAAPVPAAAAVAPPAAVPAPGGRLRASPAARQRAAAAGIDLATLRGSGPQGALTLADVERAIAVRPAARAMAPAERLAGMRQAIAAAMLRSKREIPHYYLGTTLDMARALAWLEEENARRPVTGRLLAGVLLLKAVALALRQAPELNGHWLDGGFRPGSGIHVGTAIALRGGGLVAPALHAADAATPDQLMAELRQLVQRARAGSLRSSELADATITVTSLGEQGVDTVYGIIHPPQVALVGFGRIAERPWVVDGRVVARPLLQATLSADHRASDGHRGARFLALVESLLQEPETL
ncbi:pyruvate dehydrogenase E2 component (dihydrolipoamide acetyltransferase) [Plasticicumulans lactativorans]|uniref:Dihydrolipoamide acetyltransferase component of pyruvate dehydrogenase complex n=2 Tax=Plasticicumulans lactativorans TaxID=1133106 RepID=A0A4R2KWA4_9GAMM|nr:pyruvate dehydrogenase E2 component (dihydrolipoamide acetyltransferase) [Plasticicumulans lactativorans]